jgi:hypothetical protein
MTDSSIHIEVIEHCSDEFVVFLASERYSTPERALQAVDKWITEVSAHGIDEYLATAYGESATEGSDDPQSIDLPSGVTINISSPSQEILVQIKIPYDVALRLLQKQKLAVERWDTGKISSYIANQVRCKHLSM